MLQWRRILLVTVAGTGLLISACGQPVLRPNVGLPVNTVDAASYNHGGAPHGNIPGPSQFATIQGVVVKVLPGDNSGLKHQNWVIKETSPTPGALVTVNNDITVGQQVTPLAVGAAMTIKGVMYHDPGLDGIHWTHHANSPNDAGYIKLATGQTFQ